MEFISSGLAFVLGTFLFWPILILLAVTTWTLANKQHEFISMLFFGALVYLVIARWEPLKAVLEPWNVAGFELGLTSKIVLYGIAGVIWSFVYWILLNRHNSNLFRSIKEQALKETNVPYDGFTLEYTNKMVADNAAWFQANSPLDEVLSSVHSRKYSNMPDEVSAWIKAAEKLRSEMNRAQFQHVYVRGTMPRELLESVKPRASAMSSTIATWIIYWPFSVVWYLVRDFTVQFAEFMVNNLGRSFQRITAAIFRDSL